MSWRLDVDGDISVTNYPFEMPSTASESYESNSFISGVPDHCVRNFRIRIHCFVIPEYGDFSKPNVICRRCFCVVKIKEAAIVLAIITLLEISLIYFYTGMESAKYYCTERLRTSSPTGPSERN